MEGAVETNNSIELVEKHETNEDNCDKIPKEVLKLFNMEEYDND